MKRAGVLGDLCFFMKQPALKQLENPFSIDVFGLNKPGVAVRALSVGAALSRIPDQNLVTI